MATDKPDDSTKAQEIAAVLQRLADTNSGVLTPTAVVKEASNKKSILHDEFTWDDKEAAAAFRIEQARRLIRSVRIIVRTTTREIRSVAYVRDPRAEPQEQGYVSVESLRDNEDLAREAVSHACNRAAVSMSNVRDLAAVLNISDQVDAVIDGIEALRRPLFGRKDDVSPPVQ